MIIVNINVIIDAYFMKLTGSTVNLKSDLISKRV